MPAKKPYHSLEMRNRVVERAIHCEEAQRKWFCGNLTQIRQAKDIRRQSSAFNHQADKEKPLYFLR